VAIAFGVVGGLSLLFLLGQSQLQIASSAWSTANVVEFTAAPLFIFMGAILSHAGIMTNLFDAAQKWLGFLPGGMGCSVIGANAVFGAMSGSNVAAVATFGKAVYPEMERQGYLPAIGLPAIAVAGTIAVLIPPSLILIIYGGWQAVSVARLFAGGLIPGIILSIMLMLTLIILVKLNPRLAPKPLSYSWRERLTAMMGLIPWLAVIALVLGTIFGGVMTPTEAGALGAFLGIGLALYYRKMSYEVLKRSFLDAARVTSVLIFIICMAKVIVFVFQRIGIIEIVTNGIIDLEWGTYGTLAMFYVLYLFLGMFFDSISMMLLTLPFVMPVIFYLGLSPLWFGVVYVVIAEIGMITPPFGINLFILNSVVPKYDIMTIARGCVPFLVPLLLFVALLTAFPQLVLWLPRLMF